MRLFKEHYKSKQDDEYGFTLIEILVVIIIMGILAAIAIPLYLNYRQTANDAMVVSEVNNVRLEYDQIRDQATLSQHGSGRGDINKGEIGQVSVNTVVAGSETFAVFYQGSLGSGTEISRIPVSEGLTVKSGSPDGSRILICGWFENSKNHSDQASGYGVFAGRLQNGEPGKGGSLSQNGNCASVG